MISPPPAARPPMPALSEMEREMDGVVIQIVIVNLEHQSDWDGVKWKAKTVAVLNAERALAAKVIRYLDKQNHDLRMRLRAVQGGDDR